MEFQISLWISIQPTLWPIPKCMPLSDRGGLALLTPQLPCAGFYDSSAGNYDLCFVVPGFENTITSLHYWYNSQNHNEAVLVFGDSKGRVIFIPNIREIRAFIQSAF